MLFETRKASSHLRFFFTLFCFFLAWDRATGRVGPPICSSEIKLVTWEEG